MLIDWFTVGAQILNFLILLFLLKIFLYDKIVAAMKRREENIAERLRTAQEERDEAKREKNRLQKRREQAEEERQAILQEARDEAAKQRDALVAEARNEAETLRKKHREAIEREQESFLRELRLLTGRKVSETCRKVLRDLADESLESRLADVFAQKLEALSREDADRLASTASKGVEVRSAFEPDESRRERIRNALEKLLPEGTDISFNTDPDMVLGMEARAGGVRVAWSADDYLDHVRDAVRELLEQSTAGDSTQPEDGEEQ
ncbi:F0F1 ATP synthase subunit delta [Salidesulfovibrio brasiliensis]|uniref:F0F1 ATP synthase subunit delta n=1 Tax=Salidesulfovibrio brasiliensis TaxID=221711 RepID=UPI0006D11C24|nr:F0F1 ATP synthase subunit delta [Salidesulfovibrio brasiliensis]